MHGGEPAVRYKLWAVAGVVTVLAVLAGCGGGGGGSTTTGGDTTSSVGTLSAQVSLAGVSASSLTVEVDGQPVTAPINPDGSFTVQGLAPGDHVVDVVADGGMQAGRATFTITAGGTASIASPIPLSGSGVITGTVTEQSGSGPSTPAVGVEVTAVGGLSPLMSPDGSTTVGSATDPTSPIIFPPPPGLSYSAITGDDGVYKMDGVAAGWYLVGAMVPGYQPAYAWVLVTNGSTVKVDLALNQVIMPGIGTVQGTVTGAMTNGTQAPIEGATVTIAMGTAWVPPAPPPVPMMSVGTTQTTPTIMPPPDVQMNVFRTLTDSAGHYSLNVPAGTGKGMAWAQGYAPNSQALTLTAGGTVLLNFLLSEITNVPPAPAPPPVPGPVVPPPPPPGG